MLFCYSFDGFVLDFLYGDYWRGCHWKMWHFVGFLLDI